MAVASGPVVARGAGVPKAVPTSAAKLLPDGAVNAAVTERVVLPVARATRADPAATITSASTVRTGRAKLRLGRATTEVRLPILGATVLAVAAARVLMRLRRACASAAVQATQDAVTAPASRRALGALLAVVQRPQAEVAAVEGLAAPVRTDGRGLPSLAS